MTYLAVMSSLIGHRVFTDRKPKQGISIPNKDISVVGSLDAKTIDAMVNCLFEAEEDNIAPIYKKLLCPPFQDSLLKDMFNKDR